MVAGLSLTLVNRMEEVPRLLDRLDAFAAEAGLSDDLTFRLSVALDEVVTNIVRHAFDTDDAHEILLRLVAEDDGCVTAVVEDDGRPFDPRSVSRPDIDMPVDLRPIGGLGVHLVRSMTRSIDYRRDGDRNVLTLTVGPDAS